MTDRELMKQALDALEGYARNCRCEGGGAPCDAAKALRARLAQPEQEPVAWYEPEFYSNVTIHKKWAKENGWLPLYTAPPQREWQGLTNEEIDKIKMSASSILSAIYLAEAQLKGKNGY